VEVEKSDTVAKTATLNLEFGMDDDETFKRKINDLFG